MNKEPKGVEIEKPSSSWQAAGELEKWLPRFYSECGREVTLAYTTLNQMKNWAMAIIGLFISGIFAFTKVESSPIGNSGSIMNPVIMVGAVLAYVLTLRFFIRAILCYINLVRWNTLQSDIVSYGLVPLPIDGKPSTKTKSERRKKLLEDIVDYYHNWASPIDRITQVISNLKLGFALLLALPLFFIVLEIVQSWSNYLVRGLVIFALGDTLIELNEFFRSTFFDTPKVQKKRKAKKRKLTSIFPIPASRIAYVVLWILNVTISIVVSQWPQIKATLHQFFSCAR